jgi:hypothetical protein
MTEEEIKNYFGNTQVYKFAGTLAELNELMISIGISYNYLVDQYQVYVVAQSEINDTRATLI